MSENGVNRLLLVILVISGVHIGTPLECYFCTSIDSPGCTSSLSGIEKTICSDSVSTTVTETLDTTSISTESTTTSDSSTTNTSIGSSTSSSTDTMTTKYPSSTISEAITSSATSAETASTTSMTSNNTATEETTSTALDDSTVEVTTSATVSDSSSITSEDSTTTVSEKEEEEGEAEGRNSRKIVRVVRDADISFACYTLTLIKNGTTVTDRGCVIKSSSMCSNLNKEKYPGYNLTTCTTCTENGCNSSAINLSGIPSVFMPLIMFLLTR